MTFPNPPLATCQAEHGCSRIPCFRAQLEATAGPASVRRHAEACADHLGSVVRALTSWARDQNLTSGQVTVLAVDPATRQPASVATEDLTGFAFSTIPLTP
jgi:hypothetical protein